MTEDQFGPDTAVEDRWEETFADVGQFETGAVPVDAVLRRGKGIRVRRRVAGGSALAVAAALSISVPVAIAGGPGSGNSAESGGSGVYGASASGGRVTVNPTSFSHGKGHFSGAVDGKQWSVDYDDSGCANPVWVCGLNGLNPGDEYATLDSNYVAGQPDHYTLHLRDDVGRAAITLQDGEVLRLEAVPVPHARVVLFELPKAFHISRIDLFDTHGAELAYSLPFSVKGSQSIARAWYRAGQKAPADAGSVELTRGEYLGYPAVITAYVGPSGPCLALVSTHFDAYLTCDTFAATATESFTTEPGSTRHEGDGLPAGYSVAGLVALNVARIDVTFADGTTSPVPIKSLGGYHYFAYIIPKGKVMSAMTGYDAAGKPLPADWYPR